MTHERPLSPGWILLAGLALTAVGLALEPQDPTSGQGQPNAAALPSFATSDSNGSMIAVTGIDVTGSSLLYLVDTENRALSVYQATGGTSSMMNLKWVGARKIDLDMRVDGFNDESEYTYKQLAEMFEPDSPSSPGSTNASKSPRSSGTNELNDGKR